MSGAESDATADVESRVDELADEIAFVDEKHDARVEQAVMPRLNQLEQDSDDAQTERAELFQLVEQLQERVSELDARLEAMAGLADDQETNPEKRQSDLRQAMVRRAKARGESGGYEKVALYYKEVQDIFADLGHGDISKPDCYKAMTDLAEEAPGFEMGKKDSKHGNRVKAIRLDMDELRAHSASSNPTTRDRGAVAETNQTNATSD